MAKNRSFCKKFLLQVHKLQKVILQLTDFPVNYPIIHENKVKAAITPNVQKM